MTVGRYHDKDVKRASFQYDGHFALYRHINEGGTIEYREENFKGTTVDSVINSKRTFEQYVQARITATLREVVGANG